MKVPSDSATSPQGVFFKFLRFNFLGGEAASGHSPGGNCFAGHIQARRRDILRLGYGTSPDMGQLSPLGINQAADICVITA